MPDHDIIAGAMDIVERGKKKGLVFRVLGGVAVYLKIKDNSELLEVYRKLERSGEGKPMFPDLDIIAYRKQRNEVTKILSKELQFKMDPMISMFAGENRLRFYNSDADYWLDVFLSKLEFSHDVNFGDAPNRGRLELDFPTISPTDLLLAKMEIHNINSKDLIDTMVLILNCEISSEESSKSINASYISEILSNDWGFWYDFDSNMSKVILYSEKKWSEGKLSSVFREDIKNKVQEI